MRRVLRNPYYLDKALQISWLTDRPLPESEREFRAIFWQQIVRADDRLAAGAPRRREEAFQEIAVRRARALAAYVACNDLDTAVVDSLRHDSLIVSSDQSAVLVAPAHDVLEDWAILQWIEEQHLTSEGSFRALSKTIGTHPAVRRAYRKWVAELIERDPGAADRLFDAAIAEAGVSAQFRDDTLVSLLRAPSSPAFLERHVAKLLANSRDLLRRVIHLLRVACVTSSKWLPLTAGQGSLFNVPEGPAWASILRVVRTQIQEFTVSERLLLLGFIEDWARGVSWWAPYPDGAESVAAIAHWLLPHFDTYQSEGAGQRTLKVIAKIPKADVARFEALLRGAGEKDKRDRTAESFRDVAFSGLEGMPAARDLPDLVVSVASDYLLCSQIDLQGEWRYGGSLGLETHFGVKEGLDHDYFPASAYHGPWIPLLRYHPTEGLSLLITVFNRSTDWYAHPRVPKRIEPPLEIELTFSDGMSRRQWGNPRLWNLYRGTSVGPYVLQSLLMALERWLLEFAEARPAELDAILLELLRRSDSAALTAVVASVAAAFPHVSGETLLVLLRSPTYIRFDRQRMAIESGAPSMLSALMPGGRTENKIYKEERMEAGARPHRRRDLETAIANLQLGPLAARVHEILDQHRRALPPASEQTDSDRAWRLSMHRMDLRQYSVAEVVAPDSPSVEPERRQIRLDPNEPEPDVKEMVDQSAARFSAMNARLGLLMWALHVFKNEEITTHDPANWRQQLSQARTSEFTNLGEDELDPARGGPRIVAAVCVRDHWQEMSGDEQDWCIEMVCSEVMRQADVWNQFERMQRYDMSADRPCASVISVLVGKPLSKTKRLRVQQTFATALTHSIEEVRWYAAWGVARHLWSTDHELAMRCVNALATEATLIDQALDTNDKSPYRQRRHIEEIAAEAASVIRQQFWQAGGIAEDVYQTFDTTKWFGAEAKWLAQLDDEYATGDEMMSAIFLGSWWKEEVRHWRSLEGHAHHVHSLFEDLPPSSVVLDDYVRFLYHIGEQSLPESFVRIAKRLKSGGAQRMLKKTNTVFMLEVLLQRHVYGRPLELKRNPAVRDAVLLLLDLLVENGSSAAFRMRDDFVTPASNS